MKLFYIHSLYMKKYIYKLYVFDLLIYLKKEVHCGYEFVDCVCMTI